MVADAARRLGAGFRSERVSARRRPQPGGPGPAGPPRGPRSRRRHRSHRRRPGRDGPGQPAAGRRRARPGRHAGRSPPSPVGPAPGRDRGAVLASGPGPGGGSVQRRSPAPPQPDPPRAAPPVLGRGRARRRAGAGPPGRSTGGRCRPARRPGLAGGSRRTPRPWPTRRRPWPGGACGAGCWAAATHPPPLDAVDRVLAVARQRARATEVPGGRRVVRSRGPALDRAAARRLTRPAAWARIRPG